MSPAAKPDSDLPILLFEDLADWEAWLAESFSASPGLWLKLAKKAAKPRSVSYAEALEVALCYGWIDGQKRAFDDEFWLQKFTPRGARSIWSKINRAKALEVIEEGRMQPSGLAAIERAKANGQWEAAYDSHCTAEPPEDFMAELERHPEARDFYKTLNSQNRYAILFRIQTAKLPETRRKRIEQFVSMLEKHEKLHP